MDNVSASLLAELESVIKDRGNELRVQLQKMNPNNNPEYAELFRLLVDVDTDLRIWRGQARLGHA
jgi:hypothetical protein